MSNMSVSGVSSNSGSKPAGGGPPADIKAQLEKYGLSPQGSLQADKAAIQAAKAQQQAQNGEGAQGKKGPGGKPPGGPPPEIMSQLQQYGLQPQGSLQADLAAIDAAKSGQTNNSTQNKTSNPIAEMMKMFSSQSNDSSQTDMNSFQQLLGQKGAQTSMSFLA